MIQDGDHKANRARRRGCCGAEPPGLCAGFYVRTLSHLDW